MTYVWLCVHVFLFMCVIRCLHPVLPFTHPASFCLSLIFFSFPNKVSATFVQKHSSKANWLSLNCKESFFVSTGRSLDPFSTERRLHKSLHNTHIHSAWQRGTVEQKKKEGKIIWNQKTSFTQLACEC